MKGLAWVSLVMVAVVLPLACAGDDAKRTDRDNEGGEGGAVVAGAGSGATPLGGMANPVGDAGAGGREPVDLGGAAGEPTQPSEGGGAGAPTSNESGNAGTSGAGGTPEPEPEVGLLQVTRGAVNGNGAEAAFFVATSADGSHAFFISGEQLTPGDADGMFDLFQRAGGQTTLIASGAVSYMGSSNDGTRVFFESSEALVAEDTDASIDVYQYQAGTITLLSGGSAAQDADFLAASTDGARVFFRTQEGLLASDTDFSQYDIYERFVGNLTHITSAKKDGGGSDAMLFRAISEDGTHVLWDTFEEMMESDDETGGASTDTYEYFDGQTFHVTAGNNLLQSAICKGVSADGLHVFYETVAAMDPVADTDGILNDVYDHFNGTNVLLSIGTSAGTEQGAVWAGNSRDGLHVYFRTTEQLAPTDTDTSDDIYERVGNQTFHVSVGDKNSNTNVAPTFLGASSNGTRIFFRTNDALTDADTDASFDIYVREAGTTTLITPAPVAGNSTGIAFSALSPDGQHVYFMTAEQLVAEDTDTVDDLYVWNDGTIALLSTGATQAVQFAGAALDGSRAFFSSVERLSDTDTDDVIDVYSVTL